MPRKRRSVKQPDTSATTPPTTLPSPSRKGVLALDEVRRRILRVDPTFASRYRQKDGE